LGKDFRMMSYSICGRTIHKNCTLPEDERNFLMVALVDIGCVAGWPGLPSPPVVIPSPAPMHGTVAGGKIHILFSQ